MKIIPIFAALGLTAVLPAGGQVSLTDTLTFTGVFSDIDDGIAISEDDEGGGSSIGSSSVVSGIPKFDSALGTLTAIRVSASYDYSADAEFTIDSLAGPGPHSAEVSSLSHDLGVNLRRSNAPGTLRVLNNLGQVFPDSYFISDPDLTYSFFDSGSHEFSDGEENIFNIADLTDFIGSGNVEVLEAGVFVPIEGAFTLVNVDSVTLATSAAMNFGQVRVSYDFVPIPELGTLVLALGGLPLLLARKRCR